MLIKKIRYIFLPVLLFSLVACQISEQYYLNALANQILVQPLPFSGEYQLKWQDMYLDINHTVSMSENSVSTQGTVGFSNHPQIMYAHAQGLKVSLFLLDKNNRVVGYQKILQSGWLNTQDKELFKGHLDRPAGAVAYTFGYEVNFVEGEPDSGMSTAWELPKVGQ